MNDTSRPARAGGRGARRALRSAPDFDLLPALKRGIPECEVMDLKVSRRYSTCFMLM